MKDAITQIKEILGLTAKVKFFEDTLADGTQIRIEGDAPVEQAAVFIVLEDGSEQPAPDSEIVLSDGTTITVVSGLIATITPAGEEAAAPVEQAEAPATGDFVSKEDFQKLSDQVAELQKALEALQTNMSESSKAQTQMAEVIRIIGAAPSDKPIAKVEPAKFQKTSEKEILLANKNEEVAKLMKQIKSANNK